MKGGFGDTIPNSGISDQIMGFGPPPGGMIKFHWWWYFRLLYGNGL